MSQAERAFFTTTGFSSPNVSSQYDKATHINFHRSLSSQNPQQHLLIAISTQTLHFYHHSTSSGRKPCNMCVQVLIRQSRGNQTVRAATRSQPIKKRSPTSTTSRHPNIHAHYVNSHKLLMEEQKQHMGHNRPTSDNSSHMHICKGLSWK